MMQNLSKTQLLSLIVGVISAMAGLITTLGQIWGFTAIASQIGETCFAVSGFANIVFFGITVQKAKAGAILSDNEEIEDDATPVDESEQVSDKSPVNVPNPNTGTNIDGVMK
jgi:hypothetical protein